jgi:hypothetical protein
MPVTYLSGMDTCLTDAVMGVSWSDFGVRFYPHALKRFFKADAHGFTDQLPDIAHFGAAWLNGALQAAASKCKGRRLRLPSCTKTGRIQKR